MTVLGLLAKKSARFQVMKGHPELDEAKCWTYSIIAPMSLDDLAQVTVRIVWDEGDELQSYTIPLSMEVKLETKTH